MSYTLPSVLGKGRKRTRVVGLLMTAVVALLCFVLLYSLVAPTLASRRRASYHDLSSTLAEFLAAHAGLLAALTAVLCTYLAQEQPPQHAASPVPIEKRPDYYRVCILSGLLCLLSGMVNAVAIIQMAGTVAHQTGNTSHFGRLLGNDGARYGALLVAFTLGAGVTGYTKSDGEALFQGRFCPGMVSAALGTAVGVLLQWVTGRSNWVTLPLWAFCQGIQNGVTSRFTCMPLRTTHHTGTITDAGASIGMWLKARSRGDPLPNMRKAALLLICLFSYAAGGLAAKVGTDAWGIWAAMVPAVVMAGLGAIPAVVSAAKTA